MRPTLRRLGPVLLAAAASCGGEDRPAYARNVLLVSLDTLRADRLGCYGYERDTTPHIDRWARDGLVVEDASSPASWTSPAHMSMLTGLYARSHGVDGFNKEVADGVVMLAELLKERGFATRAFVNTGVLLGRIGFERGFDEYEILRPTVEPHGDAAELVDKATAWMSEPREAPFFLFLHVYDTHSDYVPLPEYEKLYATEYDGPVDGSTKQLKAYRNEKLPAWGDDDARRLNALYDAEIRQLDETLARLFEFLEESGVGRTRSSSSPRTTARSSSSTDKSCTAARCSRSSCTSR